MGPAMKTIAILYIATGRYTVFWDDFYRTAKQYLLTDAAHYRKHFFVFTDSASLLSLQQDDVTPVYQAKMGWPKDTLMRFDVFLGIRDQLEKFDYIYFFNGNTIFEADIQAADILPEGGAQLVLALQPHVFVLLRRQFPYESRIESTAGIAEHEGEYYFMGGVNGGRAAAYLAMCTTLSQHIHQDLARRLIALWHDESHLNRYAIGRQDIKILPPLFSRGETERWKVGSKLYFADKNHPRYGGHAYLRGETDIPLPPTQASPPVATAMGRDVSWKAIKRSLRYGGLALLYGLSRHKPWKALYRALPKTWRTRWEATLFDQLLQQRTARMWQAKIGRYRQGQRCGVDVAMLAKRRDVPDKVIWQYWGQGWDSPDLPPVVALCRQSVDRYAGEYTVIRLDERNIGEYLNLPDFIRAKRQHPQFQHAFYSDLIRVMLLHAYGGVWLDATVLLTDRLPEKWHIPDLWMFQRAATAAHQSAWQQLNPRYFSWSKYHKVRVLNSVMFARRGSKTLAVMQDLLLDFWRSETRIPHYFFWQILFNELLGSDDAPEPYPAVDDTVPHLLYSVWQRPVAEVDLDAVLYQNPIHKLTYLPPAAAGSVGAAIQMRMNADEAIRHPVSEVANGHDTMGKEQKQCSIM